MSAHTLPAAAETRPAALWLRPSWWPSWPTLPLVLSDTVMVGRLRCRGTGGGVDWRVGDDFDCSSPSAAWRRRSTRWWRTISAPSSLSIGSHRAARPVGFGAGLRPAGRAGAAGRRALGVDDRPGGASGGLGRSCYLQVWPWACRRRCCIARCMLIRPPSARRGRSWSSACWRWR